MTLRGRIPVEGLSPGDRIVTRDRGAVSLRGIRRLVAEFVPVRFCADLTGARSPATILPAAQLVHVRDWRARALVGSATAILPVRRLIDGEFITVGAPITAALYTLRFELPHIIYAGGIEVAIAAR